MTDINKTDPDHTRPSKPQKTPKPNEPDIDATRPIRPPDDPENTILSHQPRPAPPPRRSVTPPAKPVQPPYRPPRSEQTTGSPKRSYPNPAFQKTVVARRDPAPAPKGSWWHYFGRGFALITLVAVALAGLALAAGVVGYFWIASELPPAEQLRSRSVQFATTQILDREGNLLWEIIDPTGGRRTIVTLDQVSPDLINATIATEDRFFYSNVGVDPIAIARAVYYNVTEGEIVSGASTITQQLARNILLAPEERTERSLTRKVREAVLAMEINRRYTKRQILEIYLNQIYYGNLAYGIEAAAQTYFGKSAKDLTLAEASLLAGLPQSPAVHDPYVNPEGALARQADVLRLMAEANYITPAQANEAQFNNLDELRDLGAAFNAPHFVNYVRQELERFIPPSYIYQEPGLRVQTTLDPRLQDIAETEVRNQVNALADRNVTNGALVALDTETGQILAMVGSKDFRDEAISGQINMALSPRQPGSTMKPLTYLATFEKLGWTPSTLLMDVPVKFPDGAGNVYEPNNYDNKFHGPVSLRVALANSYNIPPIKALQAVGVDALREISSRLGITTLTQDYYGLSLTLGSGEVPLIEMTEAYQAMANGGVQVPPTSILQITDGLGRVIEPPRPQPKQVLNPAHAYLITNIMADNQARSISFGENSYLHLSRPAAAKTGTTNDFRDNWTIGYTPDIVTGVWVGNADRTPMFNVSGLTGAGPIWHNFMEQALAGRPVKEFERPSTIVALEICADSGTLPSEACPERRTELFYKDQPPLGPEHDIHQLIEIDLNTGLRANEFCRSHVEKRYFRVYPPDGWEWSVANGIEQPPTDYCPSTNIVANITSPLDGSTIRDKVALDGSAVAANFSHYLVEFGVGTNPQAFATVLGPVSQLKEQGNLGTFDTTQVENGPYTLRLVVFDQNGGSVESRIRVLVDNAPTPTIVASPTATSSPTLQPSATSTQIPPTPTPTATLIPATETPIIQPTIETPSPEPTVEPTVEPTATPTTEATTEPLPEISPEPVIDPEVQGTVEF
ncbi:MAG: penicillin-binding protein 1C [Anaerolineae bacterium]|nr:penicillin-binding protein 1C [Anaerolineae bacterium]